MKIGIHGFDVQWLALAAVRFCKAGFAEVVSSRITCFRVNLMSVEKAIWSPFWYELDQPLEVGQVASFQYFCTSPSRLADVHVPIFYHGNWNDTHLYYSATKRIPKIHHPQIGDIQKIDTRGLAYTIMLTKGTILKVEAEESPGVAYDLSEPIEDWRVLVEMEPK